MKVLLLSRYARLGASSRIRLFQYLPSLLAKGWVVDVNPLFSDIYLKTLYQSESRGLQVISSYWRRLKSLAYVGAYDLLWIEKELFPFMPAVAENLLATFRFPYIVDYDDAIFHRYDCHRSLMIRKVLGHKIDSVMKNAALVVAGNDYLAQRASEAGARHVEIIPTVVDLDKYTTTRRHMGVPVTIGWIGSPATSHYLRNVASALEAVKRDYNVRIIAVGASEASVEGLPIEVWPWSEETEMASIHSFDIGIMPLPDEPWERGKCGYKLIQYMACGLPVIASPVGVNVHIVKHEVSGFLVKKLDEWELALRNLLDHREMWGQMGAKGREIVEERYSLSVQAPRLERLLKDVAFCGKV